jgi:hypoxanthine phosphoribosyltransferase
MSIEGPPLGTPAELQAVSVDRQTALGRVLLDKACLQDRVAQMGEEISRDYQNRDLVLLGVLKGAIFFIADLMRAITVPVTFDFISISRYQRGSGNSGEVRILKDLEISVEGRDVLLVEDIVDTGLTLNYLLRTLRNRKPASIEVCTLLDRPYMRLLPMTIRYAGFSIPNDYVVGYGLDFQERYRQLSHIRLLYPPPPDI